MCCRSIISVELEDSEFLPQMQCLESQLARHSQPRQSAVVKLSIPNRILGNELASWVSEIVGVPTPDKLSVVAHDVFGNH